MLRFNSVLIARTFHYTGTNAYRHSSASFFSGRNISSSTVLEPKTIAIRRETQSPWERRAPLAPQHVRKLVRKGIKVLVQPSNRRAYSMQEYTQAGATVIEDISDASIIMGVKQVPIDSLIADKTFCFFSHTIKAQQDNMQLLDAVLEKNIRLIDYEKMCDSNGNRVVAFGVYAGVAGMINILHGLGIRLLALGHHTPFMYIGPAHNYRNGGMARQAFRDAGYEISLGRLPRSIGPLTFIFTGTGNVSQGAQEMFKELPHEFVDVEDLPKVSQHGATNKVYGCVVSRDDHYVRKEGGAFDAKEFSKHPERYGSDFNRKIAPYASCIINGIYWAPSSPKLLTLPDAKKLLQPSHLPWLPSSTGCPSLPHRLLALCDISADPGGSIEFMNECTTIDKPFCLYDADENKSTESFSGPGVLVCSIDNMPTQMPLEATDFFGDLLLPHMPEILKSEATTSFDEFDANEIVKGAVIASNSKLTDSFQYIQTLRDQRHSVSSYAARRNKRVLLLGSGRVAGPVVEYLTRSNDVDVSVVGNSNIELDFISNQLRAYRKLKPELTEAHDDIIANNLDVNKLDEEKLSKLISAHELVISLLPVPMHTTIANACIGNKVDLLTASYSAEVKKWKLDEAAKNAGITMLYEVGLDPGLDHMLAMECFDEVVEGGGYVKEFVSFCGGLPAAEYSENPLRYKFSWSPKGMFTALKNAAKYYENGKIVNVDAGGIPLLSQAKKLPFLPGFNLEGYPNRDSTIYKDIYNLPKIETLIRGTIRFDGFSKAMMGLIQVGLLSDEAIPLLHDKGPDITWLQLISSLCGQESEVYVENLKRALQDRFGIDGEQVSAIEELGLLSNDLVKKSGTPIDTLAAYLAERLQFGIEERDMAILRHDFGIQWPNDYEKRSVSLVTYGDPSVALDDDIRLPGYSAMAKTVGYTAAISAKMVLDGEIQQPGLVLPMSKDIYRPVLARLRQEGIYAM